MRKDHLLAALTAAALLAVSTGTALAQAPRIGFLPSTGSVNEGATAAADSEHPLLIVNVRAWNLPAGPAGNGADGRPTARQQAIDALGEITIETEGIGRTEAATISPVYNTAASLDEDAVFADNDSFQLTLTPVQDDDSLNDTFSLRLRSTESINTGGRYRGTVIDDDPLANATFSRTDIRVFEWSELPLSVRITAPEDGEFPVLAIEENVVLRAVPAAAVSSAECSTDGKSDFALRIWSETEQLTFGPRRGEITIDKGITFYRGQPAGLRLAACGDTSDFRDSTVVLTFKESSLETSAGRIAAGPPAVIQILNSDPLPTVSLATPALTIDEGTTETVAIIAEGTLANAVMQVGLEITGDARLSLLQAGRQLVARGGVTYMVELGSNTSTVLTIRADGDETLAGQPDEDGHGDDCGRERRRHRGQGHADCYRPWVHGGANSSNNWPTAAHCPAPGRRLTAAQNADAHGAPPLTAGRFAATFRIAAPEWGGDLAGLIRTALHKGGSANASFDIGLPSR